MSEELTVQFKVHFGRGPHGRKHTRVGEAPTLAETASVPRIAKLMALAIRFEALIRTGAVQDYAELARLGHVTRARITQIINLLNLAPDIQEDIIRLSIPTSCSCKIYERDLRPIAIIPDWRIQRQKWMDLMLERPE